MSRPPQLRPAHVARRRLTRLLAAATTAAASAVATVAIMMPIKWPDRAGE